MDKPAISVAVAVQVGLSVVVLQGTLGVPLWTVAPVGGVLVGAVSRGFQSELIEGFLVGTVAAVLTVLAYFFVLGGWADATSILRTWGVRSGRQYQFVVVGLVFAPLVGLVNAATAIAGSSLRRRIGSVHERVAP